MNKKFFAAILLVLTFAAVALIGCTEKEFADLVISAENASDVPEGEYYLPYTIKDYSYFDEKYNLDLSVTVFDQANNKVEVNNNRSITVKNDNVYTVTVICSATINGKIESKTKIFTVTAKKSDILVQFSIGGQIRDKYTITVAYGETVDMSAIPAIPNYYPPKEDGINKTIVSKEWVVKTEDGTEPLAQKHLENLEKSLTIYGQYEYSFTYDTVSIVFDSNGGSEVDTISVLYSQTVKKPDDPVKENAIFGGWFTDEECTEIFDWQPESSLSLTKNYTLYAKWLDATVSNQYAEDYEYELSTDDKGYAFYTVRPKSDVDWTGRDIAIPVGKNNIPVKGLSPNAFCDKQIKSVYFHAGFSRDTYNAFYNCTALETVTFAENILLTYLDPGAFYGCSSLTEIVIPDSVTKIGDGAFYGCTDLSTVTLSENLTQVSKDVFYNCSSLTEVLFPDSVSGIYENAFYGCSSLTRITFSQTSSLTWISVGAFEGSALTEVKLPYYFAENNLTPFKDTGISVTYHDKVEEEEEE